MCALFILRLRRSRSPGSAPSTRTAIPCGALRRKVIGSDGRCYTGSPCKFALSLLCSFRSASHSHLCIQSTGPRTATLWLKMAMTRAIASVVCTLLGAAQELIGRNVWLATSCQLLLTLTRAQKSPFSCNNELSTTLRASLAPFGY